jgi:hypothetical protein
MSEWHASCATGRWSEFRSRCTSRARVRASCCSLRGPQRTHRPGSSGVPEQAHMPHEQYASNMRVPVCMCHGHCESPWRVRCKSLRVAVCHSEPLRVPTSPCEPPRVSMCSSEILKAPTSLREFLRVPVCRSESSRVTHEFPRIAMCHSGCSRVTHESLCTPPPRVPVCHIKPPRETRGSPGAAVCHRKHLRVTIVTHEPSWVSVCHSKPLQVSGESSCSPVSHSEFL